MFEKDVGLLSLSP